MKRRIAAVAVVLLATLFAGQAVASAGEGGGADTDMLYNSFMLYN